MKVQLGPVQGCTLLIAVLFAFGSFCCFAQQAVTHKASPVALNRGAFVGAWKLIRTDYTGSKGNMKDPKFILRSEGLIVYDASGWMSVQIMTLGRPVIPLPPSARTAMIDTPHEAQLKAAAMDTYYAYFGTWTFDVGKQIVTHHRTASLFPYEIGTDAVREAKFDGRYLSLIVHESEDGDPRTRILVWERLPVAGSIIGKP